MFMKYKVGNVCGEYIWRIKSGVSLLLTIMALVCLVAIGDLTSKDNLTSQALQKLLELQRTFVNILPNCGLGIH